MWVRLDYLFDSFRMGNISSKYTVIQQVYQIGIRENLFKPGRFACTSWTEYKEAVSRRSENSLRQIILRESQIL